MSYETKTEVPSVFWVITFVLFTMPISGVCLDIYVPSLPNIQQFFGVKKTPGAVDGEFIYFGQCIDAIGFWHTIRFLWPA